MPSREYPADSVVRLRAAAVPFVAHVLRDLLARGELVEVNGRIVLAKERKE